MNFISPCTNIPPHICLCVLVGRYTFVSLMLLKNFAPDKEPIIIKVLILLLQK